MSKTQKIEIELKKTKQMLISEWVAFALTFSLIGGFMIATLRLLSTFEQTEQLLALIVFLMVTLKLMSWIKMPLTYMQDDIVSEIDYVMRERKK